MFYRILRNINLQNLKRASAFIDIMDRHVDQEAQDFLTYYRSGLTHLLQVRTFAPTVLQNVTEYYRMLQYVSLLLMHFM